MKNIKPYDEFVNEEINLKKLVGSAVIGATLLGTPACDWLTTNPSNPNDIEMHDADSYNFGQYNGKVISSIRYGDDEAYSGDYLILSFTDGTSMKVYAYKYDMKIGDADGTDANVYNYNGFKGKTIKNIRYGRYEGQSGDLLHINFTDGRSLVIYAYKYTMEIHK